MGKKGDSTKSRICAAALQLFRERGFESVTIEDICSAASVTRGTFYYHFEAKDEVLFDFYDEPEAVSLERLAEVMDAENYWDQLWLCYAHYIDHTQRAGAEVLAQCFKVNLTQDRGTFDTRESTAGIARTIIRKGQAAGQFRNQEDPERLAVICGRLLLAYDLVWAIKKEGFEKTPAMRGALESLLDVEPSLRKGGSPLY